MWEVMSEERGEERSERRREEKRGLMFRADYRSEMKQQNTGRSRDHCGVKRSVLW